MREFADAASVARKVATKIDQPAYIYWEGNALDGGYQVYCGVWDAKALRLMGDPSRIFGIALPDQFGIFRPEGR